jgi:hypothetical protein
MIAMLADAALTTTPHSGFPEFAQRGSALSKCPGYYRLFVKRLLFGIGVFF